MGNGYPSWKVKFAKKVRISSDNLKARIY